VVATIGLVAAPPVGGAPADPEQRRREIGDELARLREQVDATEAQEADLLADLALSRQTERELEARVQDLEVQARAATEQLAAAEAELAVADAALAEGQLRLDEARLALQDAIDRLRAHAVAAYMDPGRGAGRVDALLRLRGLGELHDAASFIEASLEAQREVVERQRALEAEVQRLATELEIVRVEAGTRRDVVAGHREALAGALAGQEAARRQATAERARQEGLVGQVRARRGAYEQRITSLEAESSAISALLRRSQSGRSSTGSGQLRWPVASPVITSNYGWRVHPIFDTRRLHAGMDLRAATGTPVLAAGAGTIVAAGPRGGYGNAVIIDHGGTLATLYGHLSRVSVRQGQRVSAGQVIGAAGSTGYSTGPHLHFEVRVDGAPVDPRRHL
jgi:murein DD-endopeptidase MepM/ murein hydrolase activator NlpD